MDLREERALADRRLRFGLLCIALLALAVRVAWLIRHGAGEITWDGAEYARIAQNLIAGAGYLGLRGTTNFVFPPFYSLAIAALLPITGDAVRAGVAVSLLSGALLVVPVYMLGAELFSRRSGLLAAILAAVFPFVVELSTVVLSDMLYLTLITTSLAFAARALRRLQPGDAVACGAAAGLAYLTRPEGVLVEGLLVVAIAVAACTGGAARRLPALALAVALPFAVLAAPYIAFLSGTAGHVRVEGKSLLNLDIGMRMAHGMSYAVAADAIDRTLAEVGPELDRDYYFEPPNRIAPPARTVVVFGLTNMLRHVPEIAHVALSRLCGTALVALLALIGLLAPPWTRRSTAGRALLVAYAVVVAVSLASVFHFWERYFTGFVPVIVVFAAHGIDAIARLVLQRAPRLQFRLAAPLVAAFLLACTFSISVGFTDDASTTAEREAGRWLAQHGAAGRRVLGISDQAVYYAQGVWSMLPWSPDNDTALRYVRKIDPAYVILNREYASERPYVNAWLASGVPDRAARPVYSVVRDGRTVLTVLRWHSDDEARR